MSRKIPAFSFEDNGELVRREPGTTLREVIGAVAVVGETEGRDCGARVVYDLLEVILLDGTRVDAYRERHEVGTGAVCEL